MALPPHHIISKRSSQTEMAPENIATALNHKFEDTQDDHEDLTAAASLFSFANNSRIPIAARLDAMKTVHAFAKETDNDVNLCQMLLNDTEMPLVRSLSENTGQNFNEHALPPTVPDFKVEETNTRRPSEPTIDSCWVLPRAHEGYSNRPNCYSPNQSSLSGDRSVFVGKDSSEGSEADQSMLSSKWAPASGKHDLCRPPNTLTSESPSQSIKSIHDTRERQKISSLPKAGDYPDLPLALFSSPGRDTFGEVSKNRINTSVKVVQKAGGKSHATLTTTIPGIGTFSGHGSCDKAADARATIQEAYFQLLLQLHSHNLLRTLFSFGSKFISIEGPRKNQIVNKADCNRSRPHQSSGVPRLTSGAPIILNVNDDVLKLMKEATESLEAAGLPAEVNQLQPTVARPEERRGPFMLTAKQRTERDQIHKNRIKRLNESDELANLRTQREELPMQQFRAKVLDLVENNVYSIIVGATGSGKTTQVPQILLDHAAESGHGSWCNIICTQPRVIAATSVASRVAEERGEVVQETVGYSVRFDSKLPSYGGSITYCTTGILLQRLRGSLDDVLGTYSHILVDEVHERDTSIDFLLNILKHAINARIASRKKPIPKVVLMSATMDTNLFAQYFATTHVNGTSTICPSLSVPGRTFPVIIKYLDTILPFLERTYSATDLALLSADNKTVSYLGVEQRLEIKVKGSSCITGVPSAKSTSTDQEEILVPMGLIVTTVAGICQAGALGAILVFLPGLDDITKCDSWLREKSPLGLNFDDSKKFKIILLHSSLPLGQRDVFCPVPRSCRKIILATNIAETSITLPDIVHVIDTGKVKEKRYEAFTRVTRLQCTWISKSSARQRSGRAGRVRNGNYYALYTKSRHELFNDTTTPEMMRSDLQQLCLAVKAHNPEDSIPRFFANCIEPPPHGAVDAAVESLRVLGALTISEQMTDLGRILAKLPVSPSIGKMMLLGMIFRCFDPLLILAATTSDRPLFVNPLDKRSEATAVRHKLSNATDSDQFAIINGFRGTREAKWPSNISRAKRYASDNFIHFNAFTESDKVMAQIVKVFVEAGLLADDSLDPRTHEYGGEELNTHSEWNSIIKAAMIVGYHPNLAVLQTASKGRDQGSGRFLRSARHRVTELHPSSLNTTKAREEQHEKGSVFTFAELAKSSDGGITFLRDTTAITPLTAALLGGRLSQPYGGPQLNLDGWLTIWVQSDSNPSEAAKCIMKFKQILDRILGQAFAELACEFKPPSDLHADRLRKLLAFSLSEILDLDLAYYEREVMLTKLAREEQLRV